MNARVFLLLLVTTAFMAIWDADCPTELRQVVARSNDAKATASVGSTCVKAAVANVAADTVSRNDAVLPLASANDEKLVPLPQGLPRGTWHAFNHEGDTIRITIERRSIPPRSPLFNVRPSTKSSADSCVITGSDGVLWCFVKEEIPTAN